jgi:DNA-binding MarR family transcriptional regulator
VSYTVIRRQPVAEHDAHPNSAASFVIEESTAHLVSVAARLFSRALHERLDRHDVSVAQWSMLLFLWEEEGLTQKDLSRRQQIEEPTAARTLDRMERDGLIERVRDEHDRRRIHIHLTERGQELRDELVPAALEVNALATHGLSDDDKLRMNSLLSYVIARLA